MYELARKFHGECSFVNAIVIQETKELAQGILSSKYFETLRDAWKGLDLAVVGIGGEIDEENKQWFDMLTQKDFQQIKENHIVGDLCCRFFNTSGQETIVDLSERTIAISYEELKRVPISLAVVSGKEKAQAILAVLRQRLVNYLVIDYDTMISVLELDSADE